MGDSSVGVTEQQECVYMHRTFELTHDGPGTAKVNHEYSHCKPVPTGTIQFYPMFHGEAYSVNIRGIKFRTVYKI